MPYPDKETAAFVRLRSLARKGYWGNLAQAEEDSVHLRHPAGALAGAPRLILWSDGRLLVADPDWQSNKHDINYIDVASEADWHLFQSFANSIPAPTMLQAINDMTVWEVKITTAGYLIGLAILGVIAGAIGFLAWLVW